MILKKPFLKSLVIIMLVVMCFSTVATFAAIGDGAEQISINEEVTDNLESKDAINNYKFELPTPGKVSITFEHENVEKSYSLWQIDMFDSEQNIVMNNYKSKGDEQKGQSQNVYLKSGTYYIRVKGDSYGDSSSVAYNLCVNYTENIGNHETELNDNKETANIITEMNKQITGDLRDSDDVDFFKFTTVSSGKVHLEFKHKDTEDWMHRWEITVYDDMDEVICELESDGTEESRKSEELDVVAGTYYVKVESGGYFNHSDCEYILAINGTGSLENPIKILLDGKQIQFDQPPIIQDGRTLVPLRAIFEAMEATVLWDDATKTVTSIKLETTIVLKIGDNILKKNSDEIELDVPAQIVNGRTLVPARAVAESFGADVGWDGNTKTVIITQK